MWSNNKLCGRKARGSSMCDSHDVQKLAQGHARFRRFYNWVWFGFVCLIASGGALIWLFTRNTEHLLSGFFLATFPLLGLLYNHFLLFNPYRDPIETQRRLERRAE